MLAKFSIEYSASARHHSPPPHEHHYTDDPLACEQFLQDLLVNGMAIHAIRHEGQELPRGDFDRMVKVAAAGIASRLICTSLDIKPDEERFRFGFAA
jgi:hypothetical protein